MKISEAIKEIIKLKGLAIFNDYKRFRGFLADFSTDTHKREFDVFKNAVDENMLKMCIDDSFEERRKISKLRYALETKGISEDWINFIIESFALPLGWNYTPRPTTQQQPQTQQVQKQNTSSSQNEWTCSCGTVNTTNFCGNCGSAKPVPKSVDWTCVCGTVNTTTCGKQKGQQQTQQPVQQKQVQKPQQIPKVQTQVIPQKQQVEQKQQIKPVQQSVSFKNAKVGDYVKFGNYPQTSSGGVQPIEWQVLSKENNKMLVISRYGLDVKRFDSSSNNWSNSEIRKWLNGDFYNKVFTDQEKKFINLSNLSDVDTSDNVFFLSEQEAEKYFANDESRKCKATEYAVKNGAWVADSSYGDNAGYSVWWLRSPNPNYSDSVFYVSYGGSLGSYYYVFYVISLARPALSINL